MRYVRVIIGVLVCLSVLSVSAGKRPVKESERLQTALKRDPGNMDLRCELVQAQLAEGDTTAAEEALSYALKMDQTSCLCMQKARLSIAKEDAIEAARFSAKAVKAGLRPEADTMIYVADRLSDGAVRMYLHQMAKSDKQNTALWTGLGQIAAWQADTTAAIRYYETAYHLGDSTVTEVLEVFRTTQKDSTLSDSVMAEIPLINQGKELELKGKIKGLSIRITVDTTATRSSISGVETLFMLKNEYITRDDILDNTAVVIKRLELTETVVLTDMLLQYESQQDSPVILCMRDLERLGHVRINESKRVIEIVP